jgi:hypothetical protein
MRSDSPVLLTALAGTFLCVACTTDSSPDSETGGVPVIRPTVTPDPLPLREVLRMGDVEGEEHVFFRTTGLALDASGTLYVLEADGVRVFDSAGTLLRRFGRQGQGPGEFRLAYALQVVRDTVVVADTQNRLHFFLTDGTHVRTRVYRELLGEGWRSSSTIGTPDGWLLEARKVDIGGWQPGQPMPTALPTDPFTVFVELHWLDATGDLRPAGFHWEAAETVRWLLEDGSLAWERAPYAHTPRWAVDGLGRAYVAASGDYVLDVYAADGSPLRRMEMDVPRIAIDDDLRERWLESRCRGRSPCLSEQAMSLPGPEYLPAVEDVLGFSAGHVAVRRADTKPDPADGRAGGAWDLFDPEGAFLGTLPATLRPRWFDGQTLLTIERGALDEEQVVMYRVR